MTPLPHVPGNGAPAAGRRPRLRGVLHHWAALAALGAGAVLVALAPGARSRSAAAVFAASLVATFAVSGTYHRVEWGRRALLWMRRLDHATIFLLIAGTYTPVCLLALDGPTGDGLLVRVWLGALAGVAQALLWPRAPRLLAAMLYVGLGWMIVPYLGEAAAGLGAWNVALLAVGGVLYTVGAGAYVARRPDLVPGVFGYHELFHAFTLGASAAHFAVVIALVRGG